jgi:DNA-binding CsgD family transcriptional regulator
VTATDRQGAGAGQLTPHELRIVTELARGGTHQDIGRRLGLTTSAVTNAIRAAGRRLGTTSRPHLVARAIGLGLIPADIAIEATARGSTVERVARDLAAVDWLTDPEDEGWWASRTPRFREDYRARARHLIAIVRGEPLNGPQAP